VSAPLSQLGRQPGPVPFAGIGPLCVAKPDNRTRRICAYCGAILAHDNDDPEGLRSPCRRTGRRVLPFAGMTAQATHADPRELAAALLLLQRNLHRGEPLDLRAALEQFGVEVSIEDVCPIVRWLRRRGFELEAAPGRSGHELLRWRPRFRRWRPRKSRRRRNTGQLSLFR
jgi:hypothetical protein